MLDLKKLDKSLDEALSKETAETLREFLMNKRDKMKVDIKVPDGVSGEWRVYTEDGYKYLNKGNIIVMHNREDEIDTLQEFLKHAKGSVLITGLGLGVLVEILLPKDNIKDITVVENSEDVMKLVAPTYLNHPLASKLQIVVCDAYDYQPPEGKRYDAVWHDIWYEPDVRFRDEVQRLIDKYKDNSLYQNVWMKDIFLCNTFY